MELDWIIQEPIDFEYKQYILLDYIKKTGERLEKFELYPAFQELTLHFASLSRVVEHGQFVTLKRIPEEVDDEILLSDLIYKTIVYKNDEDKEEMRKISTYSHSKIQELFMVAKSLWSIVNDSISLELENDLNFFGQGIGYFYFDYKGLTYVYEYSFSKLADNSLEHKCNIKLLDSGKDINVDAVIMQRGVYGMEGERTHEDIEDFGTELPIFKVSINQEFPLEGCLLSLIRRKVMNYIFQSVKINKIKHNNDD